MAPGTHLGVVTGEFGGNQFGVIQLPATSGTGAPSLVNWVQATIPNTPDSPTNLPWSEGDDPHDLATYVSPTTGRAYAILDDDVNQDGTRTWIAVVDLQRVIDAAAGGHTVSSLVTCQGAGQNGTPAVPNCAVRFIQSP